MIKGIGDNQGVRSDFKGKATSKYPLFLEML
jgi:hypothetical protein